MKSFRHIAFLIFVFAFATPFASAQVRAVYDRGAAGLYQALEKLNNSKSVLMIGAHPDDEDTALLAYLARGEHARAGYLSLTRGDGGQNIIGSELGEALGVIRTEELLQARRLDGAEQFFARAYDYGFSKTLAEAKQKWDEQVILCDAVRVIRRFRPLVVVSQFNGTPADGHGQHQFAGYIAPLAVKAAADMNQCGSAGPAWTVQKFYQRHRGQGDARLKINTGKYDPVIGRSYFELAMEARSQHKSQEQGVLELKGEQISSLNLVGPEGKESNIFEGLDTTIVGAAKNTNNSEEPNRKRLEDLQQITSDARKSFDLQSPEKILPLLARGYSLAVSGESSTRVPGTKAFFLDKQKEFAEAIKLSAGIQIDAIADRETLPAGESFSVAVKTFVADKPEVKIREAKVVAPDGWNVVSTEPPAGPNQGFIRREVADQSANFKVTVPNNARPTSPYWLVDLRDRDMFRWYGPHQTEPFEPTTPRAEVVAEVLGTRIVFDVPVEYRFADDVRGEIRRNVDVVPPLSLDVDQPLLIVASGAKPQIRRLAVSVTDYATKPVSGTLSLSLETQPTWPVSPQGKPFEVKRQGEKLSVDFDVTVPAGTQPGTYKIAPIANIGESISPSSMRTIAYPHIQTHRYYRRTLTDVVVIDLKTAPVKVGYIMGSGDRVADAIGQMGFDITMISERELASGDLSKYDTIVVGIRAYQVRQDIVANNKRLMDFANNGGTLIVQYQLPQYSQMNALPYPAQMGPRVVDENAEVKILKPEHPIFNFPNRIAAPDFVGWVQERNLYNFSTMDPKYIGLLESHDAAEPENSGGLVIADVGKGKFIYCSYSLFRQLPAGVPGAYRLLANMLSVQSAARQ